VNLSTKLSDVKGVGAKTVSLLSAADLETVGDIVNFWPRTYEDYSTITPIAELAPGKVTIKARAEKVASRRVRRAMQVTTASLVDDSGKVSAIWFNQPYRVGQLKSGAEFYFSGQFGLNYGRYQLMSPSAEAVKDLPVQTGRILPIYPVRRGLKPNITRKVLSLLRPLVTMLPETLPTTIVKQQKLLSRAEALINIHFPTSPDLTAAARQRLAFEELFELLLAARFNKLTNSHLQGFKLPFNQPKIKQFVANLPFKMTGAQKRALWDILSDFDKPEPVRPMNRLLQGDVGSGKTVVAGAAAYQAFLAGYQTALAAPTEILAAQHAETLRRLLEPMGVKVALLTGSIKGPARRQLLSQIETGEIKVVVGTHALFQPTVQFLNLGFVVIDEQHRFGVKQRQSLLAKGSNSATSNSHMPHLLSMTATPIPRSLQLTVFGDLDISTLDEMPSGRRSIITKIWSPSRRAELDWLLNEQIDLGCQIYVVTPLIDNSGQVASEKVAAESHYQALKSQFKNRRLGLLHGKMTALAKDKTMADFASGQIDILVATTVIEVGVDVPNATVMLIENAEQFGLAQLHQLRGRVGRSQHQSYCYLMTSDNRHPTQRLIELEKSNDGFYLAEIDLKLRGAGEIYGTAQHGQLNLQIASLADSRLIQRAAAAADWFVASGQNLLQYKELAAKVRQYQRLTTLN
jgi:ATP-dependent DNA helicase RecG